VAVVFWGMAAAAGLVILAAIFVELWRVRVVLERVERRLVAGLEMRQALAGEQGAQATQGAQKGTRAGAEPPGVSEVDQERDTERLETVEWRR